MDYTELAVRHQVTRRRLEGLARQSRRKYVDAHCSVFTSGTFRNLMTELHRLDYIPFVIEKLIEPERPNIDFFCSLVLENS